MSSIAIVYGGSGALGKGIVSFFAKNNWVCWIPAPLFFFFF